MKNILIAIICSVMICGAFGAGMFLDRGENPASAESAKHIEKAREVDADLVCASALLTTTMTRQRDLASMLAKSGIRAKLLVGGAPVSAEWANEIGAHGYAGNAMHAVNVAKELIRA